MFENHYFHIEIPKNGRIRASPQQQKIYIYTYIHIIHLEGTFIIYEGWEPNQRATIQKFAHGMKSKRNSSLSGKNSLKMQSARPSGPKLDYYYVLFFIFLYFFSEFFLIFLYVLLLCPYFFPMFCYFPLFRDI